MYGFPASGSGNPGHGSMCSGGYIDANGSGTMFGRCGSCGSHRMKNGALLFAARESIATVSFAPHAARDCSGEMCGSVSPQKPRARGTGGSP